MLNEWIQKGGAGNSSVKKNRHTHPFQQVPVVHLNCCENRKCKFLVLNIEFSWHLNHI